MKGLLFILFPIVSFGQEITQGNSNYDAFPHPVVIGDTLLVFFKSSATHGGEGRMLIARYYEGCITPEINQVNITSMDSVSNLSVGLGTGDTITLAVRNTFGGDSLLTATSGDYGRTWTAQGKYYLGPTGFPFGRMVKVLNDTLLASYYNTGGGKASWLIYTTDNGGRWRFYDTLAYGAGTQPYNETDVYYLGNSKLLAIVRSESPLNRPSQFTSTDNGHTWIRRGGLNALNFSVNNTPTFIERFQGRLWLFSNFRAGNGNNSVWWTSNGLESEAFTDTSKWAKRSAYYHPLNDDLGNATIGIDNGYTIPFQFHDKLYTVGYDNTPLQTTTATAKTRIFITQITGQEVKAYNSTNQSIPNNANTLVIFPQVDINKDVAYNTDSNFVIIQRDGTYSVDVTATFDTSSSGTKRNLYVYLNSNSLNATTSGQQQIISQDTKGASTDYDVSRLECHAIVKLRKNEKIQVYAYQNTGGSLNLINTDHNRMATLNIKAY